MANGTTIVHKSELDFQALGGVDHGLALQAGVIDGDTTAALQASFVEMEQVTIPRQARVEELLYVISGSIRLEEDGSSTVVEAGDTVHLSADSAPTYHVEQKTLIIAAYLAS